MSCDREELELDGYMGVERLDLEEAFKILTTHGEGTGLDTRGCGGAEGCGVLDSFPLSITQVRSESDKEKWGLVQQLGEFSKMVKGSFWIVLEDCKDPRSLSILEFFNCNEGAFKSRTIEILGDKSEREILENYFSHSSSVLSLSSKGNRRRIEKGEEGWITTLRRRKGFEDSHSSLGLLIRGSLLRRSGDCLRDLDSSSQVLTAKVSGVEDVSAFLGSLETVLRDLWLSNTEEESFLVILGFNVEGRSLQERPENGSEARGDSKRDVHVIHIFPSTTNYAEVTNSRSWSSYISSMKGLAAWTEGLTEFRTQRLIYSSIEALGDLDALGMGLGLEMGMALERETELREETLTGGPDNKSTATTVSNYFSTDSCRLVDGSNGFSSTDLDSVATSINSSTENILLSKKGTVLVGLDEVEEAGPLLDESEKDPLLVADRADLGFWETALVDVSDEPATSNMRKRSTLTRGTAGPEGHSCLPETRPHSTNDDDDEEKELYECRETKFETSELKSKLARSVWGPATCSLPDCMQCLAGSLSGAKWCRAGFLRFCETYRCMGVVEIRRRFGVGSGSGERRAWLVREFLGDELSDQVFCYGESRRRRSIRGEQRDLSVYLVGDFNGWNKTSHPMRLETGTIMSMNQELYEGYPPFPHFMRGRVYSIVLDESGLSDFLGAAGAEERREVCFRIRVVTTQTVSEGGSDSTRELETYRLLSYSRSLRPSGILDSSENALMNCSLGLDSESESAVQDRRELRAPLPKCVLRSGVESGGALSGTRVIRELKNCLRGAPLYIYEANIGFSENDDKGRIGTFRGFRRNVLPRISRGGYNCVILTGVLEHYQSYNNGQYPFNFFVPYSKYGTLGDFKDLMDDCHSRGIAVLLDFNLAFADITSSNSMLQPCDRETNNSLSNMQDVINTQEEDKRKQGGTDADGKSGSSNSEKGQDPGSSQSSSSFASCFGGGSGNVDELFLDDSIVDLYESFMLTNLNTFNPSFFKHTPEVISSLFAFNKSYSRLNLGYIPMLAQILSSIHYLMTQLGVDGFRFTVPDLYEEQDKYHCLASILALINDVVHSIKPFGVTIANELLLRGNKGKGCSELTIPAEYGGIGFDYVWDTWICSSLQDIILKSPSSLNIKRDIVDELLPYEDKMKSLNKKIQIVQRGKKGREEADIHRAGLGDGSDSCSDSGLNTMEFVSRTLYGIESLEMKTVTQNPLRIAMFSWESLHTHLVGGVSPHVSELSASLARLGHEVHLFTRATTSSYLIKVHDGVLYHECPFQLNSDFVTEITNMCNSFVYYMQRWEDGLTKVPDFTANGGPPLPSVKNGYRFNICHCHDWLAAPVLTSLRRIGNNNRTTIFTVHSTEYGRCGNQSFGGQSSRISDIEREGCHTADRIICVSGVLAEEVCRLFGVNRSKIKVIYNGIHCRNFDRVVMDDAGEVKRQYGIGPLEPTFLCVARMALQKGVDLLVEAVPGILKYRSDAKFIIVGDGHQRDEIVRRSHQLGVYNSVRFVGKKSGDDVIRLYKACDAVVVPSRNEPFGIVVLEGWTAGKPVVATTSGGPRDFLTPNVDGYLVEPCKDSIAWGCCEILKNFDHSRWMGSRGRVKAAYSFSWDSIAQTTSFLYFEQCNVLDVAPSLVLKPNLPLVLQVFGENALHHHMTIFDGFDRSVLALKQMKLLTLTMMAFAKNGVFQSMGSEFGNPDSFDLPRPNNDLDVSRLRCRWDLADNKNLRFKHLEFFSTFLIRLEKFLNWTLDTGLRDAGGRRVGLGEDVSRRGAPPDAPGRGLQASRASGRRDSPPRAPAAAPRRRRSSVERAQAVLASEPGESSPEDGGGTGARDGRGKGSFSLESGPAQKSELCSSGLGGSSLLRETDSPRPEEAPGARGELHGSSSRVRVILCHELDKVLVVERNNCVFVFNYSDRFYSSYGFGVSTELPLSVVVDTQDERFGGDKKRTSPDDISFGSLKSEPGFRIFESEGLTQQRAFDSLSKAVSQSLHLDSPYRLVDTESLRQTVFLDMSPFSAYLLAPSVLVRDVPCETIGDKLFSQTIDGFVDSLSLF
ncbi:glycosyltransferase [Cryptosporidium felis]|nr:glycosyltransferase [Cryptosporidium felis]